MTLKVKHPWHFGKNWKLYDDKTFGSRWAYGPSPTGIKKPT